MKLKRQTIKRSCDDDWYDEAPWFETGASFSLGESEPVRPRSMSRAAFTAIHHRPPNRIGFHQP